MKVRLALGSTYDGSDNTNLFVDMLAVPRVGDVIVVGITEPSPEWFARFKTMSNVSIACHEAHALMEKGIEEKKIDALGLEVVDEFPTYWQKEKDAPSYPIVCVWPKLWITDDGK